MGVPNGAATGEQTLTVRDNRTGKVYTVPCVFIPFNISGSSVTISRNSFRIEDNAVSSTAFKAMAASPREDERAENETQRGLRVVDRGFMNTAVMRSQITYIDGEAGSEYFN